MYDAYVRMFLHRMYLCVHNMYLYGRNMYLYVLFFYFSFPVMYGRHRRPDEM